MVDSQRQKTGDLINTVRTCSEIRVQKETFSVAPNFTRNEPLHLILAVVISFRRAESNVRHYRRMKDSALLGLTLTSSMNLCILCLLQRDRMREREGERTLVIVFKTCVKMGQTGV